jgi:tetratricopeptide (TPR) repeat protein
MLVLIEDAQWADAASLRLVDLALDACREQPLMILALGRPEVDERLGDLWRTRNLLRLSLGPLSVATSRRLVQGALGRVADEEIDRIVHIGAGNPFFLEELVRAHVDDRSGEVPDAVLATVQKRFYGLGIELRRVLRAASIFGAKCSLAGVAHLLGKSASELPETEAEALVEREIFRRAAGRNAAPESDLVFRHELLREAAYSMLTPEDAKVGHRLAAEWLASRGVDDPRMIAAHYERSDSPRSAVPWLAAAGKRAFLAGELDAAMSLARAALGLDPAPATRAELLAQYVSACRWGGQYAAAAEAGRAAITLLPVGSEEWFRAAGEAAICCTHTFEASGRELASEITTRVLDCADEHRGSDAFVSALADVSIASMLFRLDVDTHVESELARARQLGPLQLPARYGLYAALAARAGMRSRHAESIPATTIALEVAEQMGDNRLADRMRNNLGSFLLEVGRNEEAAARLRVSLDEPRILHHTKVHARSLLGAALAALGRIDEALTHARQAVSELEESMGPRMRMVVHFHAAQVMGMAGDAQGSIQTALSGLIDAPPHAQAHGLALVASARLASGDRPGAFRDAQSALTKARLHPDSEAGRWLVLAVAIETASAMEATDEAIALAREAEATLDIDVERLPVDQRRAYMENQPEVARAVAACRRVLGRDVLT